MLSFPLDPERGARLLLQAARNLDRRRENAIHASADRHVKPIAAVARAAFEAGRHAYRIGGLDAAVKALRDHVHDDLPPVLLAALKAGGDAALGALPQRRAAEVGRALTGPLTMKFNASDPVAAAWAREHAAELAKGLSESARDRIREAIAVQQETGDDSEDTILEAVGDEARAELIARTESMMAANEGQRQGWDQAVDAGLLDPESRKVWVAAADPCPECEALDGVEVGLDEEYPDDGGDGPPRHPNCRCTEGISA